MNTIYKFFAFLLSLRTAILLLFGLLLFFLLGSFMMPKLPEYRALYTEPLLPWMQGNRFGITWWLWASVAVSALLAANTVFCSIESLLKKREARQWLLVIAPQIVHIGFLFILVAHLLSATGSFKGNAYAYQGSVFRLPGNEEVIFDSVRTSVDENGNVRDWSAEIRYLVNGATVASDVILPNGPSLRNGLGIYIQTVRTGPFPVAIIEVSREPGALWALIGGMLFLAGVVLLLILKVRRETPRLTAQQE